MNAAAREARPAVPLYAVTDRRTDGATRRIVAEFIDPAHANAAADLLRAAGASVEVHLVTAIRA